MVEIRWVKVTPKGEYKLQYRVRVNVLEVGLQEPIWSGWIDVPIIERE